MNSACVNMMISNTTCVDHQLEPTMLLCEKKKCTVQNKTSNHDTLQPTGTLDTVATAAKAPPAGGDRPASAASLLSGMPAQELPYVVFVYTDGTACEAESDTGGLPETRPREAEVRVVCSPDSQWYMTVAEPSTCRYLITLFAPPLCELPGFSLPQDTLHTVVLDAKEDHQDNEYYDEYYDEE